MADQFSDLEAKLFGSAPAKTGVAPKAAPTGSETGLFGGAPKPQQPQARPVQAPPVPESGLGRFRESVQAANPMSMLSMGLTDYVPALMRRGASAIGMGPQADQGKSTFELKKQEQAQREAIEARNPIATKIGQAGGLIGGMALTPNVAVPRAIAALPYVGKIASPFATGATYSGIGTLGETGDLGEAGKSALIGGGMGAVLSPIVDKTIGKFATRPARSGPPSTPEEAAYDTLQKAGITTPSKGVVTGDPKQLSRERAFGSDIYAKMAGEAEQAAQGVVGGPQALPAQAAEEAVAKARTKALSEKAAADAAYERAREVKGAFDIDRIQNVGAGILKNLSLDSKTAGLAATDAAQKAAKELDSILGVKIPVNNQMSVTHRDFNVVEAGRQALNRQLASVRDNVERVAVRKMIDQFDDHIEKAINEGAFSGSPDALQKWQDARKMWSQYQEKYGVKKTGSDAGSLMKTIIDEKADPVKVAEMIFTGGMSPDATMKKTAITVFDQLKRALGQKGQKINQIPELVNIKKAYMQNLMTPAGSSPTDFSRTAKQIDAFLTGPTRGLAKTMLEGREAEALKNLSDAMKLMSRAGGVPEAQKISKLALAMDLAGPVVGGVAMGMINSHPAFYGVGAGLGSIIAGTHAYRGSKYRQQRLANAPYQPSGPAFSGSYTVVPRLTAGGEEEQPPQQASGGRIERASGGRAKSEAMRLVAMAETMKKKHNETTKPLLDVDDSLVAKALEIANKDI